MKTKHIQKQLDFFVRDKAHHAYRKPAEDAHALAALGRTAALCAGAGNARRFPG